MKRLTLAAQVAIVVALAILVAQGLNFALAVQSRQAQMADTTILMAAQRIAFLAGAPERLERMEDMPRGAGHRRRLALTDNDPIPAHARLRPQIERKLAEALSEQRAEVAQVRAALIDRPRARRSTLILAARLPDGRWLSIRAPGNRRLAPIAGALALQSILIALIVLIPTLLILHRVGGSLRKVASAAARFDGIAPGERIEALGPSDVRALIDAVNAMQERIAAMLREKDLMLGAIGHDLRTPLTALRLEAEAVPDPARREALIAQIESLHGQFEQLLDYARSGRAGGEGEELRLDRLAKEAAERHGADGRVELGPLEPVAALGDRQSLLRAVGNLLDNALRYGGGATLSTQSRDGEAVLTVSDRGPGIADALKPLALAPFGRLDQSRNRSSGGHGLGLAITAAIARAHKGRLELGDADPSGLVATIALPALPSRRQSLD